MFSRREQDGKGEKMKYSYLFDTDSYKASHFMQYPSGTTSMFSYIEAREGGLYPETVFFGLQYILKEYLSHRVLPNEVEKAKKFFAAHGEPFNYDGWMYIATELKGKLPVRIRAVPEGSVIPTGNALVTVESTDPKVFWIVSWLETLLLRIWHPINVGTISYTIKKMIMEALEKSSDDPKSEIDFKLHSFGSRGCSSQESAMFGDMAHLVHFKGTDTVVGVLAANEYYHEEVAGFSIPASEHSSITSYGREHEVDAYRNMLKQFGKPGAMFACVSDSYNLYEAIASLWGDVLKEEVIKSGATVVIRPDSGNPPEVVLKSLQLLDEKFGHTTNKKGFKVLNYVRVIQGDGINEHSIKDIIDTVLNAGYSMTNVTFGMGGALLQMHNRDTSRFAMKNCSITVDGKERDVFKQPVTDKTKNSKAGRLDLIKVESGYKTVKMLDSKMIGTPGYSVMRTVFENGELIVDDSLNIIRKRASL